MGVLYLFAFFCYLKKKNQIELECSSSCGPKKRHSLLNV